MPSDETLGLSCHPERSEGSRFSPVLTGPAAAQKCWLVGLAAGDFARFPISPDSSFEILRAYALRMTRVEGSAPGRQDGFRAAVLKAAGAEGLCPGMRLFGQPVILSAAKDLVFRRRQQDRLRHRSAGAGGLARFPISPDSSFEILRAYALRMTRVDGCAPG